MKKNQIEGLAFVIFGMIVLMLTTKILVPSGLTEPGPRVFPYMAGFGIMVCGLGMAFEKREDNRVFLDKTGWKKLGVISSAVVLYLIGLALVGFIIATPIAGFTFAIILGRDKKISIITNLIISVATTAILYYVFEKLFGIFLPAGILF